MRRAILFPAMLVFAALACQTPETPSPDETAPGTPPAPLHGAWQPERYLLKDGSELAVTGQIFFAETDWTVLFFVLDDDGMPKRGSGEGGTYTLEGDSLVFTHLYHLSSGEATGSLADSPLRMEIHDASEADTEPCTIELAGDALTIHFPSGNAMTFRRRSGMTL